MLTAPAVVEHAAVRCPRDVAAEAEASKPLTPRPQPERLGVAPDGAAVMGVPKRRTQAWIDTLEAREVALSATLRRVLASHARCLAAPPAIKVASSR